MPERLVVDLGGDGQAAVLAWPDGGMPEEVSRAPLAWPLDADTLEDQVRITLRDQDTALPAGTERITEVVTTEIIRQANPPR